MNLNNEIKEFTLLFFEKIGSKIIQNGEKYEILLPNEYQSYFNCENICITFNKEITSKNDCYLIIPGSDILSLIIQKCKRMGAISTNIINTNTDSVIIRYHFFINFFGILRISKICHVDINLKTLEKSNVLNDIKYSNFLLKGKITNNIITPSYIKALDILKKNTSQMKKDFLNESNKIFQQDLSIFIKRHNAYMLELDASIKKKNKTLDSFEKSRNYRFKTLERIRELEKEHDILIETLQKKHHVSLEYSLIACEVISAGSVALMGG